MWSFEHKPASSPETWENNLHSLKLLFMVCHSLVFKKATKIEAGFKHSQIRDPLNTWSLQSQHK